MQTEEDENFKGLYILSAPALDKSHTVKFGMSECLQNRIVYYKDVFKSPYYIFCYKLNSDHTKKEIITLEQIILNVTIQYITEDFTSEYRQMDYILLHELICHFLNKYNIEHTIYVQPKWKPINNIKKLLEDTEKINRYDNVFIKENNKYLRANTNNISNNDNKATNHKCTLCDKIFKRKEHLINHNNKKNKCKKEDINPEIITRLQLIPINTYPKPILPNIANNITCNYCNKSFARKDVMNKHMNQVCKAFKQYNKDEKEKEKVELEQLEKKLKFEKLEKKVKNLRNKLKKLQDISINNNNNNIEDKNPIENIHNNIKLLLYNPKHIIISKPK